VIVCYLSAGAFAAQCLSTWHENSTSFGHCAASRLNGVINILVAALSGRNDVGHTAIQLNSDFVFGYYPTGDGGSASLMHSKGDPRVDPRNDFDCTYGPQGYTEFTLNVTARQLSSLYNYLGNIMANPGNYNLFTSNCTSVVITGLEQSAVTLRDVNGDPISSSYTNPSLFGSDLSHSLFMPEVVGMQHYGGN